MTKEKNKKEPDSASNTKAGLLSRSEKQSSGRAERKSNEPGETDISENTPKTSKEKSAERDADRPLH